MIRSFVSADSVPLSQVRVNTCSPAEVTFTVRVPDVPTAPDHEPAATHCFASFAVHVSTVGVPERTVEGAACRVTSTEPFLDLTIREASPLIEYSIDDASFARPAIAGSCTPAAPAQ